MRICEDDHYFDIESSFTTKVVYRKWHFGTTPNYGYQDWWLWYTFSSRRVNRESQTA